MAAPRHASAAATLLLLLVCLLQAPAPAAAYTTPVIGTLLCTLLCLDFPTVLKPLCADCLLVAELPTPGWPSPPANGTKPRNASVTELQRLPLQEKGFKAQVCFC
jgi:hypothetical protein